MGLPNSSRLRHGQLDALKQELLADRSLGARTTGLLALIETPEAMEGYLLLVQGQDDA